MMIRRLLDMLFPIDPERVRFRQAVAESEARAREAERQKQAACPHANITHLWGATCRDCGAIE